MFYKKLNVGSGRDIRPGWENVDYKLPSGVALTPEELQHFTAADLDLLGKWDGRRLPFPESHFEELLLSHVIEHLASPLDTMAELWRVAAPEALLTVRCPHGASDDAWEDQTHLRAYFEGSWAAFAQPYYWRADYGYRADWQAETVRLVLNVEAWSHYNTTHLLPNELMRIIRRERNLVHEMVAELRAVKPARLPRAELQQAPSIRLEWFEPEGKG